MKNVLILIALVVLLGGVAAVTFGSSEGVDTGAPRRGGEGAGLRVVEPPIGRPPKRFSMGTGGDAGGGRTMGAGRELQVLLGYYRRSYSPARDANIAKAIRDRMLQLGGAFIRVLENFDHDYLVEAIDLAGRVRDPKLRRPLAVLAHSGPLKIRAKAIVAADLITPWKELELSDFLSDDHDAVVLAALECAGRCPKDCPTFALINLLGHEHAPIREAALRALPKELSTAERDMLLSNIDHGTELTIQNSMRALARVKIDDGVERVLSGKLTSPVRETRLLALNLLSTKKSKLANPDAVWNSSLVTGFDDQEQAAALLCVEKTRSCEGGQRKNAMVLMTPLPRYMAARCLVSCGDKDGIRALLDLLEELGNDIRQDGDGKESAETNRILIAVRRLLGQVSRTGEYTNPETWRKWYENLERFIPRTLGPPPFELE